MIRGLLWLLGCQLAGELLVRLTHLGVPGPVLGIAILLLVLHLRHRARPSPTPASPPASPPGVSPELEPELEQDPIVRTADLLLEHLQLLFVPAGVGVIAYGSVLAHHGWPLGLALVGSWLLGLVVVALTADLLIREDPA